MCLQNRQKITVLCVSVPFLMLNMLLANLILGNKWVFGVFYKWIANVCFFYKILHVGFEIDKQRCKERHKQLAYTNALRYEVLRFREIKTVGVISQLQFILYILCLLLF